MYLSRVIIQNYRSIDFLNLEFSKGKNVIVGKNNSGKSNIISAINLLLGEPSPAYEKSSNIKMNDFCKGNIDHPIHICCEVKRDDGDIFDIESMKKECNRFFINIDKVQLDITSPNSEDKSSIDKFDQELGNILTTDFDEIEYTSRGGTKEFIKSDDFNNAYEQEFIGGGYGDRKNAITSFLYIFQAFVDSEKRIHKKLWLIYQRNNINQWTITSASRLRNSILQSAIIPSFRDPYKQLRIADYTWYGKLLKYSTEKGDLTEFAEACNHVKNASNKLFSELTEDLLKETLNIAYPETILSVQCSPQNIDAYKMALLYVDDGFNSLLTEKGSGIQSMVIIGLFSYYVKKIVVSGSALLVVEEPELYLHPHARRVLAKRLNNFAEGSKDQVIVTTHSQELLDITSPNTHIIRIHKGTDKITRAYNVGFSDAKSLKIILRQDNSEVFFADKVILVEGTEQYVLREIAKCYGESYYSNPDWLDEKNISIIEVGGKKQFLAYTSVLSKLHVDWYVMADFDFLCDGITDFLRGQFGEAKAKTLIDKVNGIMGRKGTQIEVKNLKNIAEIRDESIQKSVLDFIEELQSLNIFILKGDLEAYFTDDAKKALNLDKHPKQYRKGESVIDLIFNVLSVEMPIYKLIQCADIVPLFDALKKCLESPASKN
ncbi:MAG: AAA family ATPase [Methanocorpusculum sp.]|uniref:ATP-dependent nuclease n=1 Tax=Methanocorpusculum sp. TaxID=2058474 RepID=UPI00271DFBE8|nr:AAA family ATPase [Methanocorpusculum sp.]MDO9522327.1 AAA family ATPase [Methanocorpusculum sp.]